MDKKERELLDETWKEMVGINVKQIITKIDTLEQVMNKRIDTLKKVIGDYLELSSNLSIATVKANLKNV